MVQVEKERTEYKKRVDRMEEEADTLKTETTMLKRDLEEVKIVIAHYVDSHHGYNHLQPGQERQELPGTPVGSLQGWDQDDRGGEAFAAGGHQDDLEQDHVGVDGVIHDLDEDQVGVGDVIHDIDEDQAGVDGVINDDDAGDEGGRGGEGSVDPEDRQSHRWQRLAQVRDGFGEEQRYLQIWFWQRNTI